MGSGEYIKQLVDTLAGNGEQLKKHADLAKQRAKSPEQIEKLRSLIEDADQL